MKQTPTAVQLAILIVDDDTLDRMTLRRALDAGGVAAQMFEASNATQGLELLASLKIDCVLLDYNMPGRDGLWLVQEARARGIRTPLIVLTGHGDERLAVELMKAGASDYFSKASVTPERVVFSVRQALRVFEIENALRRSEQQALLAVEATQLGTWDLDPTTQQLEMSDRCKALLGIRPDEVASQERLNAALHPQDRERLQAAYLEVLDPANGGNYDIEYRAVASDGSSETWIRAVGKALFDETGRPVRIIGTVQDVGERKQFDAQRARLLEAEKLAREQAEAASRVREDLVAIVSHDLRNPLSNIATSAELLSLAMPQDAIRMAKPLETIVRSVARMKLLISDLLDVAALDGGALSIRPKPLGVDSIVRDALDMFVAAAAAKAIQFQGGPVNPGILVFADRERLQQVFSNLIGNAMKFTPQGGRITLNASAEDQVVQFSVADTGSGVPDEQIPRLFDRYWQAKQDGRLGIGLGLSIAKGIVEAHGGRIWVESAIGQGTTFYFCLPRRLQDDS